MKLGEVPFDEEVLSMASMLCGRHDTVEACGSQMKVGDILVWRHSHGGGHAMLVQEVVGNNHILTVECTNYKDGKYEGFQTRVVPIENPNERGGHQVVVRPKRKHLYHTFRERSSSELLVKMD